MKGADAGYSGTPLARKLGIREGRRVAVLGGPAHFLGLLDPLPAGVRVRTRPRSGSPFDVVVVFARTRTELARRFRRGDALMDVDGGLWVAWPKRSSSLVTELSGGDVRAHGLSCGLVDNKVCAVDEDWSALRFVVRSADRPARRRG